MYWPLADADSFAARQWRNDLPRNSRGKRRRLQA
jgi:hypothetical protein